MKKLFLLLSLLGCMLLLCVTAAAAEEPAYTFKYEPIVNGYGDTYSYGISGFEIEPPADEYICLVIPDTYNGKPVRTITANAFTGYHNIISVKFANTEMWVQSGAFQDTGIRTVYLYYLTSCNSDSFGHYSGYETIVYSVYPRTWTTPISPSKLPFDCENAEIKTHDGFAYVTADTGVTIVGCDLSGDVVIPDEIESLPVIAIAENAFVGNTGLTSISYPDTVTYIGKQAFAGCSGLLNFDFNDSLETIGSYAFKDCVSITSVYFTDVVSCGSFIFDGCTGIKRCEYADDITKIHQEILYGCSSVEEIVLPSTLTSINAIICRYNTFEEVYIPATVTFIKEDAFHTDTIWVVEPGSYAETRADELYLTRKNAQTGEIYTNIPPYDVTSGIFTFHIKDGEATLKSVSRDAEGVIEIPAEIDGCPVTTIGANAFENRSNVTEVYMPDTVTLIKGPVFNDCTNLGYIHLSENLKHIDGPLADGLPNIGAIYLPPSVESCYWEFLEEELGLFGHYTDKLFIIGKPGSFAEGYAERLGFEFYSVDDGYWGTDNILLKKNETNTWSVVDCRSNRYTNCDHILQIIPEYCEGIPITKIESEAFDGCVSQEFYIGGNIQQIDARAFKNCRWLAAMLIMNPDCKLDSEFISGEEDSFYQLVLLGAKDSTAQKYAKEHNFFFEIYDGLPFDDINRNAFYYEPLLWAYYNGITSGMSATKFAPDAPCTRAQVVTFLWRAAGCPEPETYDMPFTDISKRGFYYTALAWAYENNIVKGITKTTFSPNSNITRGQFMTFIWRTAACPEASGNNPFVDVTDGTFYYDAVLWGVENGITNGLSANNFAPTANCTRGQVVTFLYRGFAE